MKPTPAEGFADTVARELGTMEAFVALLNQERTALGSGKVDALPELVAEKTTLLEILSRCAEQRALLLRESESAHAGAVEQLVSQDSRVQATWNRLLEVARRAAELNAANASIVGLKLAHVRRAMDALSLSRTGLYGMTGVSAYDSGVSRSLAQG